MGTEFPYNKFEWDIEKAAANLRKHGISFDFAIEAFDDPLSIEEIDDREDYGEERVALTGSVHGLLLSVTFTLRGDSVRIISAREASKDEQDSYYIENSERWPPPSAD